MFGHLLSLGVLVLCLAAPRLAAAVVIQVDSTADVLADDGICTLREAVIAANSDTASGASPGECAAGSGADVIEVPAGTYTLALAGANEDAAATGDLDLLEDVEIAGADSASTIVDGADLDRGVQVHAEVTAEIRDLTIQNGLVAAPVPVRGGGIQNQGTLTIRNAVVTANTASQQAASPSGSGGGIHNAAGAWLTIEDSTVSANSAENVGGGILNEATLFVRRSTVSGNRTTRVLSIGGGGIYNGSGCAELSNSTISQNQANGTIANGGGFYTLAPLVLAHCTLTGNQVQQAGGAPSIFGGGATTLQNSILDGPCSGTAVTSAGGNVETTTDTCGLTDPSDQTAVLVADLGLGALADNGGPTFTHAISESSAARDAAVDAGCLATDQRGAVRPDGDVTSDGGCDAGAYEQVPEATEGLFVVPEPEAVLGACDPSTTTTTTTTSTSSTTTTTEPQGKVELCHKGRKTKSVSARRVEKHLRHGDSLGPCPEDGR